VREQIEQKREDIKTLGRALGVCRKMKKLMIDSSATKCRRGKGSKNLVPCPSDSIWCNYCLTKQEDCFVPKLPRKKGQYQMKPRVQGAETEMFANGVCHRKNHKPCPVGSKLKTTVSEI